ncbi:formylglycine-generating enzyme family protein [Isoptericola halotolerans]|uniref:formylglycine-generating enzyme family protein n=1 Tax=Isoptericola halotolerans TaxID=300560 RepID=UPI00388D5645
MTARHGAGGATADLVRVDGAAFRMGSERFYPEEGPVLEVTVEPFEIARTAVTNAQFTRFVADTGHVTTAERPLDPAQMPGLDPSMLEPGSLVFTPTSGPVDLRDWQQWWRWQPGACWHRPAGPGSSLEGLDDHPVVQVSFDDAVAYADWAGLRLPTEAEWELAARGGLDGATFTWGEEAQDGLRANTWQGSFPYRNTGAGTGRWVGTSPVGAFPPNGFGLSDMAGNVWEWTTSLWSPGHRHAANLLAAEEPAHACTCGCSPGRGRTVEVSGRPPQQRVLKGGSHLCAPEYCLRYRPAARSPQTPDSATTHLGFRCAR